MYGIILVTMLRNTTIIPIASGKGGVGKTLLTANLAIALAKAGHSTVAVDLDLGGSNLHTYLGIANKYAGIGDFLKSKKTSFNKLLLPTNTPNLSFVPGDGKTPFMANISTDQRQELIRNIREIKARYILLDLGAGSTFNTLNFFGLAHRTIVTTTFETAAIMNFLMFLRNFIFRLLISAFRRNKQLHSMLVQSFRKSIQDNPTTVATLLKQAERIDPVLARNTKRKLQQYHPRIVFNMGETPDDLKICASLKKSIQAHLSMEPEFFGYIFWDDAVRKAAKTNCALINKFPESSSAHGFHGLAEKIVNQWESSRPHNTSQLLEETKSHYKRWPT